MLLGSKTYLSLAAGAAVMAAYWMGFIDANTKDSLLTMFGLGAAAFLKAGLNRIEDKVR